VTTLAHFHEHVSSFLKGETSAEQFAGAVGESVSGRSRVQFYRTLIKRNVALILGQLHGATRTAAERYRPGLWSELIDEYARAHPPDHYDPSRFGAHLSAFLAARRQGGASLPAYLEEVADYQWCCYSVGVARSTPCGADIGLERTLFVRQYDHEIPAFVRAALAEPADPLEPKPGVTTVLVYRHPETLRAKAYYPSPLGLAVIGRFAGRAVPLDGIDAARIAAAERELRKAGVLPA